MASWGEGKEVCVCVGGVLPFGFTAYSLPGLSFLRRQGRGRGDGEGKQSKRGATPSVLGAPGWAGQGRPQLPFHAVQVQAAGSEDLAALSPDFKGGLLVAAACSRTSLSGRWGGQREDGCSAVDGSPDGWPQK